MIEGSVNPPPGRQKRSLAAQARKLALARWTMRRAGDRRWRDANTLWPLLDRS
ncbi:hypothetical protein [Erythrobacter litoralis]|uniref:Uncharacterized protein n=1 Tax=Erythrobacter litoralis (strain HTCC2594) TaxID=314225 RepID=Q2N5Z8_ERYLH|nr:hypothetical protein [Erythrobacter litoralis]ABC64893.1 hypothetical protein ELI_14005 [Erythrobacter litoralis HTCC2594]